MKRIVILLGVALLLCSCGSNGIARRTLNGDIYRVDRPWWDSRETFLPPEDCRDMLDLATYEFPEDTSAPPVAIPEPCKRKPVDYTPPADAVTDQTNLAYYRGTESAEDRDRLQDKLLALSNRECDKHHAAVVGTNAGSGFGFATLTSLFSGGATAFAAESTKSALAAIATFLGATRSHFNESFYRQLFVGTILQAIYDDRQAVLLNIYDKRRFPVPSLVTNDPRLVGLAIETIEEDDDPPTAPPQQPANQGQGRGQGQNQPSAQQQRQALEDAAAETRANSTAAAAPSEVAPRLHYSIDEAIRDAEEYHDRCSFYQGLVRVATTVQQASPCVNARERRDQIVNEMTAIQVTGNATNFQSKMSALQKELEKIQTKVLSCIDAAQ